MLQTPPRLRRAGRFGLIVTALGLALATSVAIPAFASGANTSPQPISKADANPGGANGQCPTGPYCSTRDGSPSLNGNGNGEAVGKPAAGAVGKADNKNPRGQMPSGSDHNAGYECDSNHGIGRSNPAHTGCVSPVTPPKVETPKVETPKVETPKVETPKVETPKVTPPKVETPKVETPKVETPKVETPTVVVQPQVLGESLVAPVAAPQVMTPVSAKPQVLGTSLAAPAASQATNPLPTFAAAGEADTSGQLLAGGFAAFAAFLALGTGVVLRRRYGDA